MISTSINPSEIKNIYFLERSVSRYFKTFDRNQMDEFSQEVREKHLSILLSGHQLDHREMLFKYIRKFKILKIVENLTGAFAVATVVAFNWLLVTISLNYQFASVLFLVNLPLTIWGKRLIDKYPRLIGEERDAYQFLILACSYKRAIEDPDPNTEWKKMSDDVLLHLDSGEYFYPKPSQQSELRRRMK